MAFSAHELGQVNASRARTGTIKCFSEQGDSHTLGEFREGQPHVPHKPLLSDTLL